MNTGSGSIGESSLLLWLLAAAVAMLAAHVYLGWLRLAQRQPTLRDSWLPLLLASVTLGTGICAVVVLAITAEGLSFVPGYRLIALAPLWLGAIVGALLPAYGLMKRQSLFAIVCCGLLLAVLGIAVQTGWLIAAGFRPGIRWRLELSGAALAVLALGSVAALWVGFGGGNDPARRRGLWRVGAGVLLGVALVGGQELLLISAGLLAQVGSVFKDEMPGPVLALAGGVLAPLVMAVMALDLELRSSFDKRGGKSSAINDAAKRRRRKHRIRTL